MTPPPPCPSAPCLPLPPPGPQEWVWRELQCIHDMKFRFSEEEDAGELASRLAPSLHLVPPRHVLCAEYLHKDWKPDLVRGGGGGAGARWPPQVTGMLPHRLRACAPTGYGHAPPQATGMLGAPPWHDPASTIPGMKRASIPGVKGAGGGGGGGRRGLRRSRGGEGAGGGGLGESVYEDEKGERRGWRRRRWREGWQLTLCPPHLPACHVWPLPH